MSSSIMLVFESPACRRRGGCERAAEQFVAIGQSPVEGRGEKIIQPIQCSAVRDSYDE